MILYEGKSKFNKKKIAAIVTGLDHPSQNVKTGPMAQIYLIGADKSPLQQHNSSPHSVCNKCPLINNGCYVNLGQAVLGIYSKYIRGGYEKLTDFSIFKGKKVRYGAYGEGLLVGLRMLKKINKIADSWTAYTHNSHLKKFQAFKKYMMASVETLEDAKKRWAEGWHTFRIVRSIEEKTANEIVCPATPYYFEKTGKKIQCTDCMLCCGQASKSPKSVVIVAHGNSAGLKNVREYLEEVN